MTLLGICARDGLEVRSDPLMDGEWFHVAPAGLVPDHNPILGTVVADAQRLWDGVRRRRKDFVEETDDEQDAELDDVVPPELPMVDVEFEDLPRGARAIRKLALAHGWQVRATRSRGTPLTTTGKSKAEHVKEPLLGENGQPLLSPTGKERHKKISTGRPVVVDSIVLRIWREDVYVIASWEDGSMDLVLRTVPATILNNDTLKELIRS